MAEQPIWSLEDLVLRDEGKMRAEVKLALGGAMLAAAYYMPAKGLWPDLAKMIAGVLVAGAVRDLFWPPYKELPAQMKKDLQAQVMG